MEFPGVDKIDAYVKKLVVDTKMDVLNYVVSLVQQYAPAHEFKTKYTKQEIEQYFKLYWDKIIQADPNALQDFEEWLGASPPVASSAESHDADGENTTPTAAWDGRGLKPTKFITAFVGPETRRGPIALRRPVAPTHGGSQSMLQMLQAGM